MSGLIYALRQMSIHSPFTMDRQTCAAGADRIEAMEAELAKARALLEECRETASRLETGMWSSIERANVGFIMHDIVGAVEFVCREHARLTAALKYEQHDSERRGTHAEGCWQWGPAHYECAMTEFERLRNALKSVLDACDQGRQHELGAGGMTIDAQMRRTVINGVPLRPIEQARSALYPDTTSDAP